MTDIVISATLESIYMVFFSTFFSILLGLPIGILLVVTEKSNIWEKPMLNKVLDGIINILRSFPFIILMIIIFPLSRFIVGSTIGTTAAIVPLSIAAAPFVARVMQSSLLEVDKGIIESSLSMGASTFQVIWNVMLPEALPSIVLGITLTIINIIGYSAMAGAIGAGGLGDLALRYGYYRFQGDIMVVAIVVIIILVQGVQFFGNRLAIKINKK